MIIAAADGSALGNPGPAGWAWYVDDTCWASGGWPHGTNNMGELMAVLDLLQQTAHLDEELRVYCDSQYVINTITKWMAGWKRRGWRKGDGKPVMNIELVKGLDAAMQGRVVDFVWVKGHAGHELNEAADRLANAAAVAYREGREPDPGPGIPDSSIAHPAARVGQTEPEPDLFSSEELEAVALTDEEHVVAMERSLLSDEVRSDRAAVAALLHPDWQEVGRSGRGRRDPAAVAYVDRRALDAAQHVVGALRRAVAGPLPPGHRRDLTGPGRGGVAHSRDASREALRFRRAPGWSAAGRPRPARRRQ